MVLLILRSPPQPNRWGCWTNSVNKSNLTLVDSKRPNGTHVLKAYYNEQKQTLFTIAAINYLNGIDTV